MFFGHAFVSLEVSSPIYLQFLIQLCVISDFLREKGFDLFIEKKASKAASV